MKKYLYLIITGLVLSAVGATAPLMAAAKNHARGDGHEAMHLDMHDNMHQGMHDGNEHCSIPFGHLIAPGWLKTHGHATSTLAALTAKMENGDCDLPPGIDRKVHATSTGTSTPPHMGSTTVPFVLRVSDVTVSAASTTATVRWHTNVPADSQLFYSTSTPVVIGATSTASIGDSTRVRNHSLTVNGLATSTTYYFLVKSMGIRGSAATSPQFSVTTAGM